MHFLLFRYCTKHGAKRADLVLLMQSFCHEVASEFFATNAPDPPHWALNSCFGVSRSVWMHFGLFRYYTKLDTKTSWTGAINAQVCAMKSFWNFSQRMHPDPLHWTLNSCIAAFHSVWVHFGLFRYSTKLGAKRAELVQLMQKFLPRSRIGIFRNECTRSTPLGPKLMFCCVS